MYYIMCWYSYIGYSFETKWNASRSLNHRKTCTNKIETVPILSVSSASFIQRKQLEDESENIMQQATALPMMCIPQVKVIDNDLFD